MGIRSSIEINVIAGLNNGITDTVFDRSLTSLLDTMNRANSGAYTLDASEALVPISFGGVTTARMIYIEADGEILVRLNDVGADPISLKRMVDPLSTSAGDVCAVALLTCEATAIYITNPSATAEVNVVVCIVGDLITT